MPKVPSINESPLVPRPSGALIPERDLLSTPVL